MSVLPDRSIRSASRAGLITPYHEEQLQPASYDVRLGNELLVPNVSSGRTHWSMAIDLSEAVLDGTYERVEIGGSGYLLSPGDFVLSATEESVNIPNGIVGRIEGKSSIGRLGLTVHVTAGYLDPGFQGRVTLEIVNLFPRAIRLRPGVFIAQLGFEYMYKQCERPYGSAGLRSRYQGADGVQGSRHRREDDSNG